MNKRILSILLALLLVPAVVWADATATSTLTPKAGTQDFISGGAVAVTDQTNGYTARVDSAGALSVMEYPKTIAQATGKTLNSGTALVGSACRVSNIIVSGAATAAGQYVLLYDAASATGTAKFDISVGTAKGTIDITIPGGATFSTGVFADSSANPIHVTITYDN